MIRDQKVAYYEANKRIWAPETVDVVKKLKAENRRIAIVEAGCGDAVSGKFLATPGVSEVLDNVIIPYSRSAQSHMSLDMWGGGKIDDGTRAVSFDNLKRLAMIGFQHSLTIDSVYAATFQITGTQVHGWIGGFTATGSIAAHVTLPINPDPDNRADILELISRVGMRFIDDPEDCPYIDDYRVLVGNTHDASCDEEKSKNMLVSICLESELPETVLLFRKDGTVGRPIELDREAGEAGVTLYRGSFNPLSAAHIKIAVQTNSTLVIGAGTYDKGNNDSYEIMYRVRLCNSAGFDVLVCKGALFFDLAMHLRKDLRFNSPINFVVGSDTMRRIMESYDVKVDHTTPYNNIVDDLSAKALAALSPFMAIDVEFLVVNRKNRNGVAYEYFVPLAVDDQTQASNVTYIEVDTDMPSSTELRLERKRDDCAFAVNAFDAWHASGMSKSFKDFVSEFHDGAGAKRYQQ